MTYVKQIVTFVLLALAGGGAAVVLLDGRGPAPEVAVSETRPPKAEVSPDLVVYYMDMGKDCTTCLYLERYTREALETYFPEALASGRIDLQAVDLDAPENAHYVSQYGLYTKSVVLVRQADGVAAQHENLSRIWELVYDKAAYMAYIRDEVQRFLDEPGAAG